jgi:hypothetical protein
MNSAFVVSKTTNTFVEFATHLKGLGYPYIEASGSIRLNPDGPHPFTFYDRTAETSFFEKYEIPEEAALAGYVYGYLAECQSESFFVRLWVASLVTSMLPLSTATVSCTCQSNWTR